MWCTAWSCHNFSVYPSPTSETIEESRQLELNGPIVAAASKPPLPACHDELNDLLPCTHFYHSNLVSHSAPKHNYCHSESRKAKCKLLVIYASIFLCVYGCVCSWAFLFWSGFIKMAKSEIERKPLCFFLIFSFISKLFNGTIHNCMCSDHCTLARCHQWQLLLLDLVFGSLLWKSMCL